MKVLFITRQQVRRQLFLPTVCSKMNTKIQQFRKLLCLTTMCSDIKTLDTKRQQVSVCSDMKTLHISSQQTTLFTICVHSDMETLHTKIQLLNKQICRPGT